MQLIIFSNKIKLANTPTLAFLNLTNSIIIIHEYNPAYRIYFSSVKGRIRFINRPRSRNRIEGNEIIERLVAFAKRIVYKRSGSKAASSESKSGDYVVALQYVATDALIGDGGGVCRRNLRKNCTFLSTVNKGENGGKRKRNRVNGARPKIFRPSDFCITAQAAKTVNAVVC